MKSNFATTRWSLVLQAGDQNSPMQQESLASLLQDYWFPLYTFVRKSGKSSDEAEDLIQGFFTRLLEKNLIASIDVSKQGRFRNFLLVCLKNFMNEQWKKSTTLKRGGGRKLFSIDFEDADRRISLEPSHEMTPEKAFDRAWALQVVHRSLESVHKDWEEAGKADMFDVLKPYLLPEDQVPPYGETAAKLELTLSAVRVKVHRLKSEFRQALCAEIAETLGKHQFLEDEINQLFSSICL